MLWGRKLSRVKFYLDGVTEFDFDGSEGLVLRRDEHYVYLYIVFLGGMVQRWRVFRDDHVVELIGDGICEEKKGFFGGCFGSATIVGEYNNESVVSTFRNVFWNWLGLKKERVLWWSRRTAWDY